MASRKWLSWLMSCGLLIGGSLMQTVQAQDGYGNGAYTSYDGVFADGATIPGTPPGPYDSPIAQSGPNPYWVAPTPQTPQIFSSGDPLQSSVRSFEGFFFRTEYLQLDYTPPGDVLLGAPQFGFIDPRIPFEVFDGGGTPLGIATIPVLDNMRLVNVPGIRATAGVPLVFGSAEASIFGMHSAQQTKIDTNLLGTPEQPLLGTTFMLNGQLSDTIQLYNDSFRASFTSKVWGSDANIYFNGPTSNYFAFSPFVGFKYLDVRESLTQEGSFTPDPATGLPTVVSEINSYSTNQIFAPQIGLRAKFENEFMAVMFDPKFGLGANVFRNRVNSYHLRSNGDPLVETTDSGAQLSPTIDLNLTGRLKITPNFWLTAGYNFVFAGHVTRPQDNIRYNDNGPFPILPDVVVHTQKQDMIFQGLTVGIELRRP